MSTVYIVQEPNRVTKENGKVKSVVPVYNYAPAKAYGDLTYMLDQGNARFSPRQTVRELTHALRNFTEDDYLLPTGDPGIIGVAMALAFKQTRGKLKVLRWMRKERSYIVLEYNINV